MATTSVSKLRTDLANMRSKYSRALAKTRSNPQVKKGSELAVELAGSAIAGYVSTTQYNRVAGIETPLILGGGLVAFSMFAKKNQVNHMAGLLGAGMLNGYVYAKMVEYRGFVSVPVSSIQQ
jgi:hypothetical protein